MTTLGAAVLFGAATVGCNAPRTELDPATGSPPGSATAVPHFAPRTPPPTDAPWVVVLGVAQDGGAPQAGRPDDPAWSDPAKRRLVVCLGLVDPRSSRRWMFEATPDFKEQLHRLDRVAPPDAPRSSAAAARHDLDGIFLTHAHAGHYIGLWHLGHEAMGARRVPVHAMPRMSEFLRTNGPWSQLVRYENIALSSLEADRTVPLAPDLRVTPFLVPHRQEYSEVVGFRIDGPGRSALFLPDIDSWEAWDRLGTRIEDVLATVDVAWIDATFFDDGEIPGRDMSGFPHPFVRVTMDRLASLPARERAKVRFLHVNHTNPIRDPDSPASREVRRRGFGIAREGDVLSLGRSDSRHEPGDSESGTPLDPANRPK